MFGPGKLPGFFLLLVSGTLFLHGSVLHPLGFALGPPQDWRWQFGAYSGLKGTFWGLPGAAGGALGLPQGQEWLFGVARAPELHRSSWLIPWAGNGAAALQFFSDFSVSPGRSPRRKVAFVPAGPAQPGNASEKGRIGRSWQTGSGRNCKQTELIIPRVCLGRVNTEIPKELLGNDASPSPAPLFHLRYFIHSRPWNLCKELVCSQG